ncbi:DNA replication factor C large subunit [Auriscalpium vulgare]|uniref:DNA replication factor C large subunit n=1 Tax=Auriscalpium vulgare TaxID=40419 RepID=A0ACB8SBY3_9AGAM|nr:DNA replication factor C large subunit [Auriscalpium vulgare]
MEVDSEELPPKKAPAKGKATTTAKASAPKPKPKPKPKEEEVDEDQDKSKVKAKFKCVFTTSWAAAKAAKLAGPSAPGSKAVPQPASPDCLAGLAFVFTGELSSFSRDEAIELAKRFGGRVVGQPSSKTSYVVLGDNAGPAKLAAIKKHNLTTLTEDAFLELIATRVVAEKDLDEKTKKKREKEQKAIRDSAKEMEQREKAAAKASGPSAASGHKSADPTTQLWTDRYAPQALKEICGNKGQVEKLQTWLASWPVSLKSGFKKPGKDGSGIFRAVMITGPPGIGKTTSAHLCAKLAGFTPIELNASDARSKKLVENSTNIYNTSLDGWMGGAETINAAGIKITDKSVLIMDEVDGMSAGDRGGVGALSALIRKTKVPIICIANDRSAPKMKPLIQNTFNLPFRKPDAAAIRSRIMTIAFKEKMKIPANVVDELINGVNSDIRQVLNMLSTWKLSSSTMDFDEGKTLAKMNEKYSVMTPFNIIQKIMGPYLFSATARETLNEKMELYFHDYSFVPLFVQENYLKTNPARVRGLDGPPQLLKQLELMDQAASSISDGDLVDALIHGSEQHWTLMPTHAVLSTIRPASFLYGTGSGYGGPNAMSFPQWLGQNSKQNKLNRALGDVQIRMRLKVSGDKAEIRQSYIPSLFPHIVEPLIDVGSGAVEDVIERMDEYYISREDWDAVVELGLGDHKDEVVLKKIATATKTALTKKYNASEHPVPFHKAQDLGKIPKKLAGGPAPDLEEAFEAEDEGMEDADDDKKSVDPDDIKNDKLVRQGGGKKASAKSTAKGKASTSKASTSKASTSKASTSKAKK